MRPRSAVKKLDLSKEWFKIVKKDMIVLMNNLIGGKIKLRYFSLSKDNMWSILNGLKKISSMIISLGQISFPLLINNIPN
jgi:hypothetical protein